MPLWPLRSETPEGVEDERERISKIRARPPVRLRAVHTTGAADGAESATREREVVDRKVGHMPRHYPVRVRTGVLTALVRTYAERGTVFGRPAGVGSR